MVGPGSGSRLDAAWAMKERVRREEGLLRQDRALFDRCYRESTVYLGEAPGGELAGFAAARTDLGYLLLLAVSPDHRRSGIGRDLVERVTADSPRVTCHVRTDNEGAIQFYRELGLSVARLAHDHYPDGGDAYYLVPDDDR